MQSKKSLDSENTKSLWAGFVVSIFVYCGAMLAGCSQSTVSPTVATAPAPSPATHGRSEEFMRQMAKLVERYEAAYSDLKHAHEFSGGDKERPIPNYVAAYNDTMVYFYKRIEEVEKENSRLRNR